MTEYEEAVERRARAVCCPGGKCYAEAMNTADPQAKSPYRCHVGETEWDKARATLAADSEAGYALVRREATLEMIKATEHCMTIGEKLSAANAAGEVKPEEE